MKRVVVLGGGLSGLSAAYHLNQSGHRVTIVETQSRIGGRVFTLNNSLADSLIQEAGPTRFPREFSRVIQFARTFRLDLIPFYPESGTVVAYLGGRRINAYEPSSEEFWGYTSLRNKYPKLGERFFLRLALRLRALARRLVGRLPWKSYRIKGGTHLLVQALAKAGGAEMVLDATAVAVSQESNGVVVEFATSGVAKKLEADFVVCALPLSVVNQLAFEPPISNRKKELAATVPFSSAVRIFLQMRRPYWIDNGHNGFAVTDTVGEVWAPHFDRPGAPALLVCYAQGKLADSLCRLGESDLIAHAVAELENVFPGSTEHFENGACHCWGAQPWIKGGWPLVRTTFSHRVGVFRRPEGRVYFAGDYATEKRWLNAMEGAIESGEYAARLIDRA